ncbi:MAG TPA: ATP-binding protein, partial [Cyclobacteriaceae bacterium]|nr:ATP-binding protein [Cyclobacteriaceae bacterium]
ETDCEIRGEVMVLDNKRRGMVLRIIKEALHNAMKHANASHVEVQLNFEGGRLFLTISDNGVGFDMATVYPKSNGLQNITNRCGLLNAACCIDSKYGEGTRIRIDLPVQ